MTLAPDRLLPPDPATRSIAAELLASVTSLPIVSPHGHVDPRLLADPEATFGSPADLFIRPDHYLVRMLHSQGVPRERLGIAPRPGSASGGPPVEADSRVIWQTFADHLGAFDGTPTRIWLDHQLATVFGIGERLTRGSAGAIHDAIAAQLALPAFRPRALFDRFGIEVLCTTDDAADPLDAHRAIRASGWRGDVRPTFRPDGVVNVLAPGWRARLDALGAAVGQEISTTAGLLRALRERREHFRAHGAVATDHAAERAVIEPLTETEADAILARALRGAATEADAVRFTGHVLLELAGMSVEDGLVMQLHIGSFRNHDAALHERYGADVGADIPVAVELTRGLRPLLARYGNDPRFRLIVFTLDETVYARELAPLAGHYPALLAGPPWWFHDSPNGIARYLDALTETAGIRNLAGFNDDTRAFCSIPARHDLWRRASCGWLAGLVVRGIVHPETAFGMASDLAVGLARRAYRLEGAR